MANNDTPTVRFLDFIHPRTHIEPVLRVWSKAAGVNLEYVEPDYTTSGPSATNIRTWVTKADAIIMCSTPYIASLPTGLIEAIAVPVLPFERVNGDAFYFSDFILHKSSPLLSSDQPAEEALKGLVFAVNDTESVSGVHLVRAWMAQNGLKQPYFSKVLKSGGHALSIKMVAQRKADIAAIDMQVLERLRRVGDKAVEEVAVLERVSLGPVPNQPITLRSDLDEDIKHRLKNGLKVLNDAMNGEGDEHFVREVQRAMNECIFAFFALKDDSFFDGTRRMFADAEKVPMFSLDV